MIDLDEIERRIPSPATECAYCYRLATLVCPVCAVMVCEDHRAIAAHGATGEDCTDAAMVPARHDAATMDRVALVAEVRRLRTESEERLRTIQRVAETLDAEPPQDIAQQVRWIVAEVRRLRAELATARATIDGSPDEPTDAELSAHAGTWLVRLYNGAYATMTAISARNARGVMMRRGPYAARWWTLDTSERFCPRPVVMTVAATLDAGPRDGDGREVTP